MGRRRLVCSIILIAVSLVSAVMGGGAVAEAAEQAQGSGSPGEEVMRPTKHGLAASPEWLNPFMGVLVEESGWGYGADLSNESKQRLADSMAARGMEMARRDGKVMQEFIEFSLEAAFEHDGPRNFDVRTGQEFARRFLPVAGPLRNYFDGVIRDSREFLSPDDAADVERWLGRMRRNVDGLEAGMKRWAQGDVDEHGNPFRVDEAANQPEESERERAELERKRKLRRLRSATEQELRRFSPESWPEFIRACILLFGFDEDQQKQAEALRLDYLGRSQAVMNSEWRQKVIANRRQYHLLRQSGKGTLQPWLFRLDQEFKVAVKPAEDLDGGLRDTVIALARPEQRKAALDKIAAAAGRHGLSEKDLAPIEALLIK